MFSISLVRWTPLACAAFCLWAGGCGGSGDTTKRFDLSGTVTFDGKPVASGTILLEPDAGKGNRGPAGFAKIVDGKFDTALGGKGTVGGPHVARISGFDGKSADGRSDGAPLFSDYTASVDLPKQKATQEFQVPASAKAPAGTRPGAGYQGP